MLVTTRTAGRPAEVTKNGPTISKMSRRLDRLGPNSRRPKRRAASKTHFFKYQLAGDPSRAEGNDLKRAIQQSLAFCEPRGTTPTPPPTSSSASTPAATASTTSSRRSAGKGATISSTNSSDVSKSNNSSSSFSSNDSVSFILTEAMAATAGGATILNASKRTRSGISLKSTPVNKRAKLVDGRNLSTKSDGNSSVTRESPLAAPISLSKPAIRTYSRTQSESKGLTANSNEGKRSSTPVMENAKLKQSEHPGKTSEPTKATRNNNSLTNNRSTQTLVVVTESTPTIEKDANDVVESNQKSSPPPMAGEQTSSSKLIPASNFDHCLKLKRESKNYAYAKLTALKVNTSKSPGNPKSKRSPSSASNHNSNSDKEKVSPRVNINGHQQKTVTKNPELHKTNNHASNNISRLKVKPDVTGRKSPTTNTTTQRSPRAIPDVQTTAKGDLVNIRKSSPKDTIIIDVSSIYADEYPAKDSQDLSLRKNQNQAQVKVNKKRVPQGSWSLLGVPEEKVIYLRDDEPPRRLICYPAIKHVEGDVIQVRDSVLLRSGVKQTDLPYIAKVCAFWEDAETGNVMMSLLWYYRPEHIEEGRKPHHLPDEIFASRHRDVDSVECIDDKCYVLTFNEYCRYRKRCKMEQVNTFWSLADVTIPVSNESYPRRNRIPDSDVNPELVFCCRQIYDSRTRRLLKNPLINPKYGHI